MGMTIIPRKLTENAPTASRSCRLDLKLKLKLVSMHSTSKTSMISTRVPNHLCPRDKLNSEHAPANLQDVLPTVDYSEYKDKIALLKSSIEINTQRISGKVNEPTSIVALEDTVHFS